MGSSLASLVTERVRLEVGQCPGSDSHAWADGRLIGLPQSSTTIHSRWRDGASITGCGVVSRPHARFPRDRAGLAVGRVEGQGPVPETLLRHFLRGAGAASCDNAGRQLLWPEAGTAGGAEGFNP